MANWEITAWYFLLAYIPTAFLGGIGILMLASFCYIIDITDDYERAWHLAWLDAMTSIGLLIGLFSGPVIFDAYGYTTVFGTATVLCAVAILYILIFVPETIHNDSSVSTSKYSSFQCSLVVFSVFHLILNEYQ